jgi:hypothetical protein
MGSHRSGEGGLMPSQKRIIQLQISGWTYVVSFPYRVHDHEMIICSGHAFVDLEGKKERKEKLFLEISRAKNGDDRESTYRITEDGIDVFIRIEKDDFYRLFIELKEHYKIAECRMNIDFEGEIEPNETFGFRDFEVFMNVDRHPDA